MAQTVLVEYTEEKELKRKSRDLSFVMMGKSQKFSKGYNSGFVPDYRHTVETMGDSEGFDYSGGVDCEDFSAPKRKCISLNEDRLDVCSVPTQVISLSKLSATERKDLQMRFTEELQQVQAFHKRILSMSVKGGNAISGSSINQGLNNKRDPAVQNGANLKRGVTGRFVSAKRAPAIPPVSNSHVMLMKQCEAILKRLMSHQYGWVFNTPVDVVKLNIPDYHTIIKHPMDLGTVKSKIASSAYSSPWDFAADVRLAFTNAMTYNPPGNDVHAMADTMSKFFETRWKPVEKKLVAADIRDKKQEETKPGQLPKNRKASPVRNKTFDPAIAKPKMTDEEKAILGRRVESLLSDMPEHIVEFLRRHCDPSNQSSEDGVEIDFATLSDDALFELRQLLDDDLRKKQTGQPTTAMPCEIEMLNEYGTSNSPMDHPSKGIEPADEDVDIGGNDPPIPCYPPVEIEKDTALKISKCSSSSSSSSDSDSSTDSDSGSSSGSESDDEVASPPKAAKEHGQPESVISKGKSDLHSLDVNRSVDGLYQSEQGTHPITVSVDMNGNKEGENAPCERQVSPDKLYRAALLRSRFADTILRAREKALDQGEKQDPEKLRREKEELERQQREEKARLQAEAKAAEEVRRRAEAEAAAEAKRRRELEREAARQALLKMEKTVEINENSLILHDLEMLRTAPAENASESSVHEPSPDISPDGMFNLGGGNALEQLGLYIKADDEEEEDCEPGNPPMHDTNLEEGEID